MHGRPATQTLPIGMAGCDQTHRGRFGDRVPAAFCGIDNPSHTPVAFDQVSISPQ